MQSRTEKNLMTPDATSALLERTEVCVLAMTGPYAVPLHYIWHGGKAYVHGSKKGEKIDAIAADSAVCMTVYEMKNYIVNEPKTACNISTAYESAIVKGTAAEVTDFDKKKEILYIFADKYHPPLRALDMPKEAIDATILFEITPTCVAGKQI